VKIPTVISGGLASGSMIFQKMPNSLAPSMRAASESSSGIVRKNWRRRKILNAPPPKNCGTVSGRNVSIQPRREKRMNVGTISTT